MKIPMINKFPLREGEPGEGGGGGENNFLDSISEEFRGSDHIKNYDSIDALAKGHIEANDLISKSIRIPGEDADDTVRNSFYEKLIGVDGVVRIPAEGDEEGIKAFYQKLGVPENADGYEGVKQPDKLEPGMEYDKNMEDWFKQTAHANNLSPKQAEGLYEAWNEVQAEKAKLMIGEMQSMTETLKKEWGNDWDKRIAMVHNTAK